VRRARKALGCFALVIAAILARGLGQIPTEQKKVRRRRAYECEKIATNTPTTAPAKQKRMSLVRPLTVRAPRQCGQRSTRLFINVCAQCLQCFIEWGG